MDTTAWLVLTAVAVGAAVPMQSAINAQMASLLGHPLYGAVANTGVATLCLLLLILAMRTARARAARRGERAVVPVAGRADRCGLRLRRAVRGAAHRCCRVRRGDDLRQRDRVAGDRPLRAARLCAKAGVAAAAGRRRLPAAGHRAAALRPLLSCGRPAAQDGGAAQPGRCAARAAACSTSSASCSRQGPATSTAALAPASTARDAIGSSSPPMILAISACDAP